VLELCSTTNRFMMAALRRAEMGFKSLNIMTPPSALVTRFGDAHKLLSIQVQLQAIAKQRGRHRHGTLKAKMKWH
jgi:hypothetical protein